jgi:hypothetical protein
LLQSLHAIAALALWIAETLGRASPWQEYVRKAEQYSVSIGWGVVGLGGGGSGSGKAAAGGSGQKRSETDDDHQMAQAMQREINSLRATPRVKPASTSNGVLGAPLGSSGLTSAAAFAAVVQHPSSSAARYEESDSDDETLAARRDRSNGGGRVVQQEQRLSLSQEPQPPSFVINQAWEGSPVSGSDDDEEYSQSRKEIEEQLESQMQDEVCTSASLWRRTCRVDTTSSLAVPSAHACGAGMRRLWTTPSCSPSPTSPSAARATTVVTC